MKGWKGLLFLSFILFPFFFCGTAEIIRKGQGDFSVSITVNPTTIPIDQLLSVVIKVTYPEGFRLNEDLLKERMLESLNLVSKHIELVSETVSNPTKVKEKVLSQNIVYKLQPLISGNYFLNLLTIPFESNDNKIEIVGDLIPITITLPYEEPKKIQQYASPLMPFSKGPIMNLSAENRIKYQDGPQILEKEAVRNQQAFLQREFPFGKVISIMSLLFLIFLFWRPLIAKIIEIRRKIGKKTIDPRREALSSLDHLKGNLKELSPEECYIHLSDILRHYIELHFHIPAKHQTTQEFLRVMAKSPQFGPKSRELLSAFLQSADLVKFAEYPPNQKECDEALFAAKQFLEKN